jgi:hypothetical protein
LIGITSMIMWRLGPFDQGDFFVSALLWRKTDGFQLEAIVVCDPTQHDKSENFLGGIIEQMSKN